MNLRVAGFPVRVEPMFFLTMGFLAFASNREPAYVVEWVVVAGVAVLIHELGHALAFRRFGSTAEITLHGFGGVTVGNAQPPRRSIVVSAAGPLAGFALGFLTLALERSLGPQSGIVEAAIADMTFASFIWGFFNLVPMMPLDGGGIMASALRLATGRNDDRLAHGASIATSALLAVAGLAWQRPLVAVFAAFFGYQNWQELGRSRNAGAFQRLAEGQSLLIAGRHVEALAVAREMLDGEPSTDVGVGAAELAAWSHLADGRSDEAAAALEGLGRAQVRASQLVRTMAANGASRPPAEIAAALGHFDGWSYVPVAAGLLAGSGILDPVLKHVADLAAPQAIRALEVLQIGLQHSGRFPEAARVGMALYERRPDSTTAYYVARSLAAGIGGDHGTPAGGSGNGSTPAGSDHPDLAVEALVWLRRAADGTAEQLAAIDRDPNFDSMRQRTDFQEFRSELEHSARQASNPMTP